MDVFVGLDVSLDDTHVCIVDQDGKILKRTVAETEPDAIRCAIESCADRIRRIGFEASSLSPWLGTELRKSGLPAIVVEAGPWR